MSGANWSPRITHYQLWTNAALKKPQIAKNLLAHWLTWATNIDDGCDDEMWNFDVVNFIGINSTIIIHRQHKYDKYSIELTDNIMNQRDSIWFLRLVPMCRLTFSPQSTSFKYFSNQSFAACHRRLFVMGDWKFIWHFSHFSLIFRHVNTQRRRESAVWWAHISHLGLPVWLCGDDMSRLIESDKYLTIDQKRGKR